MKIKVQGEVYDSPEEVLTAIGKLSADLEDLPESHPGRADLARHIEKLRAAAYPSAEQSPPSAEASADEAGTDAESLAAADGEPSPLKTDEPHDPDDDPVPPGFKLCLVCAGTGLLSEEAPYDPDNEQCSTCHGHGKVLTGSHVAGHEMRDCPTCIGNGYLAKRESYTPTSNGHDVAPSPGWPGATWNAEANRWDAPQGNPPWSGAVWDALKGTYA